MEKGCNQRCMKKQSRLDNRKEIFLQKNLFAIIKRAKIVQNMCFILSNTKSSRRAKDFERIMSKHDKHNKHHNDGQKNAQSICSRKSLRRSGGCCGALSAHSIRERDCDFSVVSDAKICNAWHQIMSRADIRHHLSNNKKKKKKKKKKKEREIGNGLPGLVRIPCRDSRDDA